MIKILKGISLSSFSSYKIGGPARFFAEISSREELMEVLKWWNLEVTRLSHLSGGEAGGEAAGGKIFVLGGGTNVLIDDAGFDGLVILNKIKFIANGKLKMENGQLEVGAGVLIEELLDYCIENSLSGLEWAGGLPGTLGGAIRGNAGAFEGEIKDVISQVSSLKLSSDVLIHHYKNSNCQFGYRKSRFKRNPDEIIVSAVLDLRSGSREEIERKINEKIQYRQEKHPQEPNIGSTFKNIPVENLPPSVIDQFREKIKTDPLPVLPSVKLIAGSGMTGERMGDVMVSPVHPNYLVNMGEGTSKDVISLIGKIKKAVKEKYSVRLEEEITLV